ncbi:MAG TPA: hypothetical protein VNP73_11155, partial [Actinomycetota bacterium]|nr:hypothetical protein [Actinomycetota bacterium]
MKTRPRSRTVAVVAALTLIAVLAIPSPAQAAGVFTCSGVVPDWPNYSGGVCQGSATGSFIDDGGVLRCVADCSFTMVFNSSTTPCLPGGSGPATLATGEIFISNGSGSFDTPFQATITATAMTILTSHPTGGGHAKIVPLTFPLPTCPFG